MKLSLFLGKCFLFFIPLTGFTWNIDPDSLSGKLREGLPSWASEQINRDFSSFRKKISSEDITKCLHAIKNTQGSDKCGLVRISMVSTTIDSKPLFPLDSDQSKNLEKFIAVLRLLGSLDLLPDLDFVFCASPSYDRPLLLRETTVPVLAVSKEMANKKVVLVPRLWDSHRESSFKNLRHDWNQKQEKAFWRGAPSDGTYGYWDWEFRHRGLLAFLYRTQEDLVDAKIVSTNRSNEFPRQWLQSLNLLSTHVSPLEQSTYKYLLSFDGRASPSSFEWQLFSGSLLFKTRSNRIEWFYGGLQEGVHYIEIAPNSSDLTQKIYTAMSHDEEAYSIAQAAQEFAYANLKDEDLLAYLYQVLCYYQKILK